MCGGVLPTHVFCAPQRPVTGDFELLCILGIEPWSSRKLASTLTHISSPTFFTILAIAGVLCAPFLIAWSLWLRQLSAVLKHMLLRQCADYLAAFSPKLEFYSEGRHYST